MAKIKSLIDRFVEELDNPGKAPEPKAGKARSLKFYQRFGALLVGLLVFLVLGWGALASINGAIIAPATVVVETNVQTVQHPEGGIVAEIFVTDGDHVEADQLLVRLDQTETKANLGIVDSQLSELLARKARLESEREGAQTITFPPYLNARAETPEIARILLGQEKLFKARRETLNAQANQLVQQVAQLEDDIKGMEAQKRAKERQFRLTNKQVNDLIDLFRRGLVTRQRIADLRYTVADLEGQISQFSSQIAKTKAQIAEIQYRYLQEHQEFRRDVLAELREAQTNISGLQEQLVAAQAKLRRVDIRSPRAGIVHQSNAHTIGGVINAAEPIMQIVPKTDKLVLEASVQPEDIDQISVGQETIVRFSAFDQRTTPELTGTVARISADLQRVDAQTPPFYVVRIELGAKELKRLGNKILKPGMPAESFIQTGKRTALNYLLKPFLDQLAHVFRES